MTRQLEALEEGAYSRLSLLELQYEGCDPDPSDIWCDCDDVDCKHSHDDCDCPRACERCETHACEECGKVDEEDRFARIGRSLWIHAACADKLFAEGEWVAADFLPERRELAVVGLWLPTEAA